MPIAQTTFGSIGNGTNEHKIPIQQQLPLNFNNAKRDVASKGTQRLQNQEHAPPQPSSSTSFPFKELSKQGVNIKEIVIGTDMLIPTNQTTTPIEGNEDTIALKAGQKVMLIQTPKGVYLRMGEKITQIKHTSKKHTSRNPITFLLNHQRWLQTTSVTKFPKYHRRLQTHRS